MKSFDTQTSYKELVAVGLSEQQASAIIKITSIAIQVSTENAIEQIKRQYRLDDGVTKHDLKKLELQQNDNLNQFKHEIEMQKIQASIEESERKAKYLKNLLVVFYVFQTLVITFLIAKI
jgi:hypothetical protein